VGARWGHCSGRYEACLERKGGLEGTPFAKPFFCLLSLYVSPQFGDIATPACVVTEWSGWTKCSAMTLPASGLPSDPPQTMVVKSRTRSVRSGATAGCPDLQEIVQCGACAVWSVRRAVLVQCGACAV
jgi:hypothetical protein